MELTTLNSILALIAIVVAGLGTMLLGSLKTVRDSNSDLRLRIGDLEIKVTALGAENVTLKNDRDALARQYRGDDKLDAFTAKLEAHHRESMAHWAKGEALLLAIADELTGGKA